MQTLCYIACSVHHRLASVVRVDMQGIAEYQKRLHATLNDVMMPPTFEDSFSEGTSTKLLPDISAALAAFSEHMPSVPMPQIPQLPRLSSMTASRPPTGDYHTSNNDIGVRDAFSVRFWSPLPSYPSAVLWDFSRRTIGTRCISEKDAVGCADA